MPPPNFRFNGKRVFLTYPQCGELTRESVRDMLVSTHGAQHYCVARESHSDGNYHIHAYGEWCGTFSSRDVRIFDVDGHHPNIQSVRSAKRVLEYILKEDSEPISNVRPLEGGGRVGYGEILRESEGRGDFLARVASSYPRDYVVFHQRLREFCDAQYPEARSEYVPRWTEYDEPDELREWKLSLEEEVGKARAGGAPVPSLLVDISSHAYCLDRPVSLLLIGGSRLGKTEWARSLGVHNYWCGQFNMDGFREEVKYAVFDDFGSFKFFPMWKCWLGAQQEFSMTDKYRKKKTVKWGKACIWLCNPEDDPRVELNAAQKAWFEVNVKTVVLFNKLY